MSKKNGRRPHRNTLAVCIIARDEEELLPGCLDSLADESGPIYDELVIGVDSRTTDRTREIAAQYGAKVIELDWSQLRAGPVSPTEKRHLSEWDQRTVKDADGQFYDRDFGSARNAVEAAATADYLYWQDADEILTGGHQEIRDIVRAGVQTSARPIIVFSRNKFGQEELAYPRQDLLHRRTTHRWAGRFHEWTVGPTGKVHAAIRVEQRERPGGDRLHGDTALMLRSNFDEHSTPWHERHLFYLLRDHAGYTGPGERGHWIEAIALAEKLIQHKDKETGSEFQSSHVCLIAGEMSSRLGEPDEARRWYLRAIGEWAAWAEPHYALGVLCYSIALQHIQNNETAAPAERKPPDVIKVLFQEAAQWLLGATVYEPPAYYADLTLYRWRRYEALGVCLARLGRLPEAYMWLKRALVNCPENEALQRQLEQVAAALPEPEAMPA